MFGRGFVFGEGFRDRVLEDGERVRFSHDFDRGHAALAEDDELVWIDDEATADDHRQVVAIFAEFAEGVAAGEFGHVDVEENGVDFLIAGADDVEGLLAVGGLDDFVAEEFEHVDGDVANGGFVVDNEDAAKVGGGSIAQADERGVGGGSRRFFGDACEARDEDAEFGSATEFAVELDPAAVILDDFLSGGEAEAGAFSGFLGGEESFEDALAIFRGDTAAVVANGDDDEGGGEGFVTGCVRAAGVFDLELDDAAFFRQGVAGIDAEIEEDLFDLGAIAEDSGG